MRSKRRAEPQRTRTPGHTATAAASVRHPSGVSAAVGRLEPACDALAATAVRDAVPAALGAVPIRVQRANALQLGVPTAVSRLHDRLHGHAWYDGAIDGRSHGRSAADATGDVRR